ncbi:MAG: dockerin type I domain-containing protein [Wenzhouxiangellaceae bacterium]
MKKSNFKMVAARTVAAGCLLGLFMAAQSAAACTVGNWSANSGNVNAGDPNTGLARYSGLCAMETPDGAVAWVQDNSPGGINRIRARFYVLNNIDSGQSVQIYRGFSSTGGTGLLFTVVMNSSGSVVLRDNVVNQTVSQSASTKWLSVEIDYAQGSGDGAISLSVNGQTPAVNSGLNNAGAALQSVRLGNLQGTAGTLNFDAYESRRTTEVGRLLVGDANNSGSVNIADASAIIAELDGTLQIGQADCNENGVINITDASCVISLL